MVTFSAPSRRLVLAASTAVESVGALRADPIVLLVEHDRLFEVQAQPSDPSLDGQWNLDKIRWVKAFGSGAQ